LVWCFKIGKKEVGISDETKTIFHQVQNCKKSLFQACVRVIFTPSGNKGKSGADGLIGLSARPGYRNAAGFLFAAGYFSMRHESGLFNAPVAPGSLPVAVKALSAY
jgi:hypothetical protein